MGSYGVCLNTFGEQLSSGVLFGSPSLALRPGPPSPITLKRRLWFARPSWHGACLPQALGPTLHP